MPSCSTRALSISSTSPCAQVNSHYVNLSIYVVRRICNPDEYWHCSSGLPKKTRLSLFGHVELCSACLSICRPHSACHPVPRQDPTRP